MCFCFFLVIKNVKERQRPYKQIICNRSEFRIGVKIEESSIMRLNFCCSSTISCMQHYPCENSLATLNPTGCLWILLCKWIISNLQANILKRPQIPVTCSSCSQTFQPPAFDYNSVNQIKGKQGCSVFNCRELADKYINKSS